MSAEGQKETSGTNVRGGRKGKEIQAAATAGDVRQNKHSHHVTLLEVSTRYMKKEVEMDE